MGLLDTLRSSSENGLARDASVSDPSLDQLRVGYMLDYEDRTWTVVRHARFGHDTAQAQAPVDRWTLTSGHESVLLEHGPGGTADVRLLRRASLADVTVDGQPFLKAVQRGGSPDAIEYQGARYERTEQDARTELQDEEEIRVRSGHSLVRARVDRKLGGVIGGVAASLNVSSVLLRVIALLGMLGLLATGLAGGELSSIICGILALAAVGVYGGAVYALPEASPPRSLGTVLSHYWLYEGSDGVVALECWDDSDWRAYEGHAVGPQDVGDILPGERQREETQPDAGGGTALTQLREGSLVDYDGSTWEVTHHTPYEDGTGFVDQWMLKHGGDVRVLEAGGDDGNVFRLSTPLDLADVTIEGQPFLNAAPDEAAPSTVTYQDTEYVLAEEDARIVDTKPANRVDFLVRTRTEGSAFYLPLTLPFMMALWLFLTVVFGPPDRFRAAGVLGGIAEKTNVDADRLRKIFQFAPVILTVIAPFGLYGLGIMSLGWAVLSPTLAFYVAYILLAFAMPNAPSVSSERNLSRYWRYEHDDRFVVLERRGEDDWSAHAGREVPPHEFENVLPQAKDGLLSTLWGTDETSESPKYSERGGSSTLHQLREGYLLDYELQTWTVTDHLMYPYEGWPADVWTLEHDGDERMLEYSPTEGGTYRLYRKISGADVTVDDEPVSETGTEPPDEIEYADSEGHSRYVITEKDARVHDDEGRVRTGEVDHINFLARSLADRALLGACAGLARHLRLPTWLVRLVVAIVIFGLVAGTLTAVAIVVFPLLSGDEILKLITEGGLVGGGVAILILFLVYYNLFAFFVPEAPPKVLSHYWVYENENGELITLQRAGEEWTARVGREVEPYEFNNILPPSES